MQENEFIEQNDIINYLLLAQNAFTLIRNITHNGECKKSDIDLSVALEKLQAVGKLSQAMHNMPITISEQTYYQRQAMLADLHCFLTDYPQYYPTLCYRFRLPENMVETIKNSHSIVDNWQQILFPA
ncbi:MAG: hypothetical protein IJR44_07080 [Neisseriaceae bacterium]|nr:hypothetical protein [Neisseriaceae bacterium]MBR3425581.1 hypothetical protein [Neisseriaceae bacterium]